MRQSRGRGIKAETEARPCEAEARPSQLKKLPRGRLEPRQMPRGLHPWFGRGSGVTMGLIEPADTPDPADDVPWAEDLLI